MTVYIARKQTIAPAAKAKRTLENRVNDLTWKDWLLFQKSFFHQNDDSSLYGSLIQFFTKRRPPQGRTSKVMAISTVGTRPSFGAHGRIIFRETVAPESFAGWTYGETDFTPFDFMIVDLRGCGTALIKQINKSSDALRSFFVNCRAILKEGGFCVVLSNEIASREGRYPLPWILASHARHAFRLRDEKIGLSDASNGNPMYVNVLQAIDEIGPRHNRVPPIMIGAPAVREQWVKPRPPPRLKNEILHPAKFPEGLVSMFVDELTDPGDVVFDPMGGTASTAVAALRMGRRAAIIELDATWVAIARERASQAMPGPKKNRWSVRKGDARNASKLISASFRPVRYTITSPPYWRILHNPGMHVADEGQRARKAKGLRTTYSESIADLGNIQDYQVFIHDLAAIYERCAEVMEPGGILTIVTKNVKFERAQYPIAWDLVLRLCGIDGHFEYAGTTFWCQDDVGLKPFGMGCDWVSNILHNYCLHLRVRSSCA